MPRRALVLSCLITIAAGCGETPVQPGEAGPAASPVGSESRYIVVLKDGDMDPAGGARELAAAHSGRVRHVYRLALKGFSVTLPASAVERLRRNPRVAYVEKVLPVYPLNHSVQTSPSRNLDRVDQSALPLNVTYTYLATGAGVTVYVLDSGVDLGQAEFEGRASQLVDYHTDDGANGRDCRKHGTGVAALVGGRTYGVAKRVNLRSLRVLPCYGNGSTDDIVDALEYVQSHAVRPSVVNISVGSNASSAVNGAVKNTVEAGFPVAVGAGNGSTNACNTSPAGAKEALTVGNVHASTTSKVGSSNYGTCVDLFAPGDGSSSLSNDGKFDGTSAASPHVAGVAALYLQNHPTAVAISVANAIVNGATLNSLTAIGTGSPNRMLHSVSGSMSVLVSGPGSVSSATATTWTAVPKGGVGHYTYRWEVVRANGTRSQHGTGTSMTTIPGYNWGVFTVIAYVRSNGSNEVTGLRGVNNMIPGACRFGCP